MELWDLYDADRKKLGVTIARGESIPLGAYHNVVHLCIFNSKGEMLIQQRQPFKQGWPDMWDVTVGGSAVSGDTSRSAMERELREELGLSLSFENTRPAMTVNFDCGFDDIYIIEADINLNILTLQPEEVQAVKWAGRDEIISMIDSGIFIPYRRALIDLMFELRSSRGAMSGR